LVAARKGSELYPEVSQSKTVIVDRIPFRVKSYGISARLLADSIAFQGLGPGLMVQGEQSVWDCTFVTLGEEEFPSFGHVLLGGQEIEYSRAWQTISPNFKSKFFRELGEMGKVSEEEKRAR
jgi:hypothetical protein